MSDHVRHIHEFSRNSTSEEREGFIKEPEASVES
jgi:hypothetical protein